LGEAFWLKGLIKTMYELKWGEAKIVNTREGIREVKSATPTQAFWAEWRNRKEGMKSKGFSVSQNNGNWQVSHWSTPAVSPEVAETKTVPVDLISLRSTKGLLKHQVTPVQQLVRSVRQFGSALDASATGVGKTFQMLATARELGLSPLVICPKSVIPSWERAAAHLGVKITVTNYEKVRTGNTEFGVWQTARTASGKEFEKFVWDSSVKMLIFDEVHRCKSTKSQNASLLIGAVTVKIPTICGSATSATNPLEMRALGFMLGLHGLGNFYQWAQAHGCHRNKWDGFEFGGNQADVQKIHASIFPEKGVRVRISDIPDFPKSKVNVVMVPVANAKKLDALYRQASEALERVREKSVGDDKENHLTLQLRARQTSELLKVPAIVELANDAIAEGRAVFIAVSFTETLTAIAEGFGDKVIIALVHGQQTAIERENNIAAFQANKASVLVANIRAGGTGISLHDLHGTPRTAIICPSYSAIDLLQALGRVSRMGSTSTSIQHIVYAAGTIEEGMASRVEEKLSNIKVLNDGIELSLTDGDLS
jgi:superfamily II DNA or RNA helicase